MNTKEQGEAITYMMDSVSGMMLDIMENHASHVVWETLGEADLDECISFKNHLWARRDANWNVAQMEIWRCLMDEVRKLIKEKS